jgi:nitrate/nitrite transporter NarK
MGVAMVVGNFAYGPLDRLFKSRKWVVLGGNLAGAACLFALWALPGGGVWQAAALLALVGLFGASFPLIMAHGRSFVPAHLVGRGVTLLNLFTIGGVAVFQMITARIHGAVSAVSGDPMAPYGALFLFSALVVLAGSAIYLFSEDRTD